MVNGSPVYLALNTPVMYKGVTTSALVLEIFISMMLFMLPPAFTGEPNLFLILLAIPIHFIFVAICDNDPYFFETLKVIALDNQLALKSRYFRSSRFQRISYLK